MPAPSPASRDLASFGRLLRLLLGPTSSHQKLTSSRRPLSDDISASPASDSVQPQYTQILLQAVGHADRRRDAESSRDRLTQSSLCSEKENIDYNDTYRCILVVCHFYRATRTHSADCPVARCQFVRPSACPSACHTPVLCLNGYTYPQSFFIIGSPNIPNRIAIFRRGPPNGGVECKGV